MAHPIKFEGTNSHEGSESRPNVGALPAQEFDFASVSCWQLTSEERESGIIWVVNDTFDELPFSPKGRWQPVLYITGDKRDAMLRAKHWQPSQFA